MYKIKDIISLLCIIYFLLNEEYNFIKMYLSNRELLLEFVFCTWGGKMKRIFKISVIGLMAVSMLSMNACGKKNSEDFEQKVETTKKLNQIMW